MIDLDAPCRRELHELRSREREAQPFISDKGSVSLDGQQNDVLSDSPHDANILSAVSTILIVCGTQRLDLAAQVEPLSPGLINQNPGAPKVP